MVESQVSWGCEEGSQQGPILSGYGVCPIGFRLIRSPVNGLRKPRSGTTRRPRVAEGSDSDWSVGDTWFAFYMYDS